MSLSHLQKQRWEEGGPANPRLEELNGKRSQHKQPEHGREHYEVPDPLTERESCFSLQPVRHGPAKDVIKIFTVGEVKHVSCVQGMTWGASSED